METKEQGKGIVDWFRGLLGKKEKAVAGPDKPRIVVRDSHRIETFFYEGYDVEARVHDSRNLQLTVFLKGQCCLDGWYGGGDDWSWNPYPTASHMPGYRIRVYLKQWAQERLNKE